MELKNYETVFIMNPVMSESEINDKVGEFVKLLEKLKAEIIYKSPAKSRRLAYPIQKKQTGIYQIIEFKGAPDTIETLEKTYRLDIQVMRFLTIALDKHGIEYNLKKKKSAFPESFVSKKPDTSKEDEKSRKNEGKHAKERPRSKSVAKGDSEMEKGPSKEVELKEDSKSKNQENESDNSDDTKNKK